jgi:hypothetical protein
MIRKRTSLILNQDLTGLLGWLTHEVKRQTTERLTHVWVKLPLDKSMKDDQTQAA